MPVERMRDEAVYEAVWKVGIGNGRIRPTHDLPPLFKTWESGGLPSLRMLMGPPNPNIPVHTPLVFDIVDTCSGRSIGGCTYHVTHPGGLAHERFPVNAYEAESRRLARFRDIGHPPRVITAPGEERNPEVPLTAELRR